MGLSKVNWKTAKADRSFEQLLGSKSSEKKTFLSIKAKGVLTVLAGFLLMMVNGSTFMIGNAVPYILSYF